MSKMNYFSDDTPMRDLQVCNVISPSPMNIAFDSFEEELKKRGFKRMCKINDDAIDTAVKLRTKSWAITMLKKGFVRVIDEIPKEVITHQEFLHHQRGLFIGEDLNIV